MLLSLFSSFPFMLSYIPIQYTLLTSHWWSLKSTKNCLFDCAIPYSSLWLNASLPHSQNIYFYRLFTELSSVPHRKSQIYQKSFLATVVAFRQIKSKIRIATSNRKCFIPPARRGKGKEAAQVSFNHITPICQSNMPPGYNFSTAKEENNKNLFLCPCRINWTEQNRVSASLQEWETLCFV